MNNEQIIWNYFICKGFSPVATAGLMGNLKAESGLIPTNLQNSYNKKLNLTDEEYTLLVDNDKYNNFVRDSAGYGLAQWTYWSRKQSLLNFARARGCSIGDLQMQLDFLFNEIHANKPVITGLVTAENVRQASDVVLTKFERPADQSENVKIKRANFGQEYYNKYA